MSKGADRPITLADINSPLHWLALGLGAGLARRAPGTWGSVVGLLLFAPCLLLPLWLYVTLLMAGGVAGIYICGQTADDWGVHDHGAIVWDEVIGMGISLLLFPLSPTALLLGFLLFRLFDIWKPWPIRLLDRHVGGGAGIMLDDVVAGIFACVIGHVFLTYI